MPVIFRHKEYKFFIYSNKGNPIDPPCILVRRGGNVAKFLLEPAVCFSESDETFAGWEIAELEKIIRKNKSFIGTLTMDARISEPLAKNITFDSDHMLVELFDARTLLVPFSYFPKLLNATPEQRENCEISGEGAGIHWDELDEDVSTTALMLGIGDLNLIL